MSEASDSAQVGEFVEAQGQAWTLSHITPQIRGKLSGWLKMRARADLASRQAEMSPEAYREERDALTEEIAGGSYNWGSPFDPKAMGSAVRAALRQPEANLRLLQLLLEPDHGEVPPEKVGAIAAEKPGKVLLAMQACLELPLSVPNERAPASQTGAA